MCKILQEKASLFLVPMATTHIDHAGIFGSSRLCDVAADGETRVTKFLSVVNIVAPGDWHVIHNPAHTHTHTHSSQLLLHTRGVGVGGANASNKQVRVLFNLAPNVIQTRLDCI